MTLQTSGAISLANLQTEYTDTAPISLSEFYRNGGKVPNTITVNVPAGSWSSYLYDRTGNNYYWVVAFFAGGQWAGSSAGFNSLTVSTATSVTVGGFEYQRGSFVETITTGTGKNQVTSSYYRIRRRTTATTSTISVNQNVPTSGTISLSQFYGGRKT